MWDIKIQDDDEAMVNRTFYGRARCYVWQWDVLEHAEEQYAWLEYIRHRTDVSIAIALSGARS